MPYYKDTKNELHWLDSTEDEAFLPQGSLQVSDEEAELILAGNALLEPAATYAQQRAYEYPPIGDQLDALFKAGAFPKEMADLLQAVKDKYPKP